MSYERRQQASSVPDRNSAPAIAAARASKVALSGSSGYCARYVRKALQSAGYEFTPNPSAYQYASRGTLAGAGFSKISNDMPTQVGDVIVYDRSSKRPHGHIQILMVQIGFLTSVKTESAHTVVSMLIRHGAIHNTLMMHQTVASTLLWLINKV